MLSTNCKVHSGKVHCVKSSEPSAELVNGVWKKRMQYDTDFTAKEPPNTYLSYIKNMFTDEK